MYLSANMLSPANWQGSLVEDFPSAKGKNEEGTEMEREFVSLWSRVTPQWLRM